MFAKMKKTESLYRSNGSSPLEKNSLFFEEEIVVVVTKGRHQSYVKHFGGRGREYRGCGAEYLADNSLLDFSVKQSRGAYYNFDGILIPRSYTIKEMLVMIQHQNVFGPITYDDPEENTYAYPCETTVVAS